MVTGETNSVVIDVVAEEDLGKDELQLTDNLSQTDDKDDSSFVVTGKTNGVVIDVVAEVHLRKKIPEEEITNIA